MRNHPVGLANAEIVIPKSQHPGAVYTRNWRVLEALIREQARPACGEG